MKTKAQVLEFMNNAPIWTLSTNGEKRPNGVPMAFHKVLEDGKLIICDVFTKTSVSNLKKFEQVCVSAYGMENGPEGYKIYGKATFYADGMYAEMADEMTKSARAGGLNAIGGAIIIEPEEILIASPGPENNKSVEA